jgi:hypothetical protein
MSFRMQMTIDRYPYNRGGVYLRRKRVKIRIAASSKSGGSEAGEGRGVSGWCRVRVVSGTMCVVGRGFNCTRFCGSSVSPSSPLRFWNGESAR